MIQFPSSVIPNKVGVINVGGVIRTTFTFNGDRLYYAAMYLYDANTNALIKPSDEPDAPSYFEPSLTPEQEEYGIFNGDTVDFLIPANRLQEGRSYTYRYVICQADANGQALADLSVGSGRTLGDGSSVVLFIPNAPNTIYQFDKGGFQTPIIVDGDYKTRIYISIDNNDYLIKNYHDYPSNWGEVRTTEDIEDAIDIPEGTSFRLYSNYLMTPYYYFEYMTKPTVETVVESGMGCVHYSATYSQSQGVSIKYYNIELVNSDESVHILTDNIYSQHIEYNFPLEKLNDIFVTRLHIVTQNNYSFDTNKTMVLTDVVENTIIDNAYCVPSPNGDYINIHWDYIDGKEPHPPRDAKQILIYRTEIATGKKKFIAAIDAMSSEVSEGEKYYVVNDFHDYTAKSDVEYSYSLTPLEEETMESVTTNITILHLRWWSITALSNLKDFVYVGNGFAETFKTAIEHRVLGDSWRLEVDLQNETLTQNLDKITHISIDKLPSVSAGKRNYLSGSLSGLLGWFNCLIRDWEDSPTILADWRKFISDNNEFLLKSPKGDVLIISVVGNPTSEYELAPHITVNVAFDWIETCDMENLIVTDAYKGALIEE